MSGWWPISCLGGDPVRRSVFSLSRLMAILGAVVLALAACRGVPAKGPDVAVAVTPTPELASTVPGQGQSGQVLSPLRPLPTHMRFDHYSVEHGLSQSVGRCFLQDSRGFLWIGTEDGLNRFDGYTFKVYRQDPDDSNSLSNSNVTSLYEGRSGVLWVGTYGGGLSRLDLQSDRFTHYRHHPDDPHSLGDDYILSVYEDWAGVRWVGTRRNGLDRFDPATGQFTHYRNDPSDPGSLSADAVRTIFQDSSGVLWVGTSGGGLNRFDPETEQFTRYLFDPDDPHTIGGNWIASIYEDRSGALWIGTLDGGLSRLEGDAQSFVRYRNQADDPHSLVSNSVTSVAQDPSGVLWIGTSDGLDRFDPETDQFVHYRHDPSDPDSLSEDQVRSVYRDRSGGMWVGTYGRGIDRYDLLREQFAHYRADPQDPDSMSEDLVWSIYEDGSGLLWIGTNGGGLDRYDRETGEWRHYRSDPDDPDSLSADVVFQIREDRSGVLWVGTSGGLDQFDREAERFVHYRYDPDDVHSLSGNTVAAIYEDTGGQFWIGTANGLNRFDRETGQFARFQNDPDDVHSLSDNNVASLHEDRSGVLWVGTYGGLNRFDRETEQFTRYQHNVQDPQSLSNDIVFSIHEDRSGALWVGTWGGGLNRLERDSGTFAHYRVRDGLPNDVVYGILEDDAGDLWLSTNNGLSRFDPAAETFHNYDTGDGLQSVEFNYNAYYKSSSGEMFFGGISGVNAFYPAQITDNPYVPPIVLTSISQDGGAIDSGLAADAIQEVTFYWPNNDFEFEFAALSFFQPQENRYAYVLEGFDKDWNETGTRRFGQYTNLPGGTYTLRLKGSNNDGVWNEQGISVVANIVPPFWATWWFRGTVVLSLAAVAAVSYRLRVRSVESQRRELEAEVASRTHELAALNAIAEVMSRSLDLQQILSDALDKVLEVMETEAGGIYILDEEAGVLNIAVQRGFSPEFVAEIDRLAVGEGFSGRVVQSGEPLVVADASADPRLTRMAVREEGLRSLAIVPLNSKGKVLGTLFAMTHGYKEFADQDVQLLASIGHQIGVAVENVQLFDTVQRRAEQFRVIHEVGRRVSSILDIDELLKQLAVVIQEAFGYYLVEIGLVEGDELVFLAGAGGTWGTHFETFRLKIGRQGITGWAAASGEPVLVPDISQDPRYVRVTVGLGTRSELAVPMKAKDKVVGVLNVESDRLAAFDQSDLTVLQSVANQAAIAIENARFVESEQRRAEQFRVLAEVGRRITLTPDVDDMLLQVVRLVQQAFGYYHVGIGLVEGDEVVYRVGAGVLWDDPQFHFEPSRLKVGKEGLTGWVAATGEPLVIPDVSRAPQYIRMEGTETRSELLVPIVVKGEVIGVLDVQSDHLNAFDDTDLAVLQSLAHQTSAAIENAQLYEQAQHTAVVAERSRLARELHDAVTQTLFSASLIAETLPAAWDSDPDEGRELLQELRQMSRGALAEMRALLMELRPAALIEADLSDLLHQLAEAASGREGLPVTVTIEGQCDLPPEIRVALYRITQEALNNVVKHAYASQATVHLRCIPSVKGDGSQLVELCISDDGCGFDAKDVPSDHLGLDIMRERAQGIGATIQIESQSGHGTRVRVLRTTNGQ